MDMGTSTMNMASVTATITGATAATITSTIAMNMGGSSACKISMLWNWYTIDSCFIARSWHITSKGMFAGSCIGVILLVISLEFLRRASREYDRYISNQAKRQHVEVVGSTLQEAESGASEVKAESAATSRVQFRPTLLQQVVRAVFHMLQFAVAYFVMLLAMYYNGYIIISIIIGAFLGALVFSWEPINLSSDGKEEATLCCG